MLRLGNRSINNSKEYYILHFQIYGENYLITQAFFGYHKPIHHFHWLQLRAQRSSMCMHHKRHEVVNYFFCCILFCMAFLAHSLICALFLFKSIWYNQHAQKSLWSSTRPRLRNYYEYHVERCTMYTYASIWTNFYLPIIYMA